MTSRKRQGDQREMGFGARTVVLPLVLRGYCSVGVEGIAKLGVGGFFLEISCQ